MSRPHPRAAVLGASLFALALPGLCQAQPAAGAAAVPARAASTPAQPVNTVQKNVIEDDKVRIEETRVRGAARRIVVHSKLPGVSDYEILVAPAGRDPAQERGGAGQRAWSLFSF